MQQHKDKNTRQEYKTMIRQPKDVTKKDKNTRQ